jgi:hypothetical protein
MDPKREYSRLSAEITDPWSEVKPQRAGQLLQEPGGGEIDADSVADHVEGRHGFER